MKIQLPQTSVMGPYGVSNSRFIEFIVNMDTGRFVSEWNVYKTKRKDGSIDSNPKHYKIEDGADIADTDSANYGLSKGLNADLPAYLNNSHTYLDVRHPADNAIRRKMVRKWKNPKNVLNGGRYADIVKKGGLKTLKHGDKLKLKTGSRSTMLTLIIFALILCLMGLTAFTKKPTSPKVETKKTETLDSVLVAKNFYRVRDAYAIKLYGQDEGMSFDVAGQRLFGSNIAIKDGLLYGSSLGDLTIEAYFQGEVSYLLEATQKLPVDKNRIKANHYSQDIVLNKVWTSLEGQETSNSHHSVSG